MAKFVLVDLLRVIEESEEVDLPDLGSDVDMEDQLRNGTLLRPEDIETVEAITLELPSSSSDTSSGDETGEEERGDGHEHQKEEEEGSEHTRRPRGEDGRVAVQCRQSVHNGVDTLRGHNHTHMGRRKRFKRRPSDWAERESGVAASARRQHAVFMRKPIDLSQPVVADQTDNQSLRATAAVYSTYMLA